MKKYIFTETQIKKIIDNQLNEEISTSKVLTASGTIRKAPSVQDDVDTIIKLRKQKVKLVILGFRSSVTNSDVYNKNYKRPTTVGSIADRIGAASAVCASASFLIVEPAPVARPSTVSNLFFRSS